MAIYYLNAQVIGRSAGRSATGAAAYRAGERIHDERTGLIYDYTRRRGDIEAEILAPAGAPAWASDRARLWNEVEKAERRGDAQVAREIVVAIPVELDRVQQLQAVHQYVQEQFVSRGMVADVAIHRNPGNPHAHIMLTMREMGPEGLSQKKNREWNRPELLEQWREHWAVTANHALERAGRDERIDHRSLAEQGAERLPQVHLGPHAHALERRGIPTEKGDHNRQVQEHNAVVIDLEKAREEKRALQVEERRAARLKAGWNAEHAKALGLVELAHGGKAVALSDLYGMQNQVHRDLNHSLGQIQVIQEEGQRLHRAVNTLEAHKKAVEELRRHQGPLAAMRRLFSAGARQEYQHASLQVQYTANFVQVNGITSEADLQRQLAEHRQQEARLPALQARASELQHQFSRLNLASRGLENEAVRKRLQEHQAREQARAPEGREQSRGRGLDRGR